MDPTGYRPSEAELATLAAEQHKARQWARQAHRGQFDGAELPELLATYTSLRGQSTKALSTIEKWPLRDFDRPAGAEVPIGELEKRLQAARQEARKAEQNALVTGWTFKGNVWTTPPDEQPSVAERLSHRLRRTTNRGAAIFAAGVAAPAAGPVVATTAPELSGAMSAYQALAPVLTGTGSVILVTTGTLGVLALANKVTRRVNAYSIKKQERELLATNAKELEQGAALQLEMQRVSDLEKSISRSLRELELTFATAIIREPQLLSEEARDAMAAAIGTAPGRRERDTWLEWARLATAGSAHAKRFAADRGFELPFTEKDAASALVKDHLNASNRTVIQQSPETVISAGVANSDVGGSRQDQQAIEM